MSRPPPAAPARCFFSCDWGTSSFRLQLVRGPAPRVLAAVHTADGIATVHAAWRRRGADPARRAAHFLRFLRPHLDALADAAGIPAARLPLVMSGMATSSLGLCELPYARAPFALDGSDLRTDFLPASRDCPCALLLISGVRTAADVMRGEETQVVGALSRGAGTGARRVAVLPGTHSKHVRIAGAQAVDFATYMTGEFFGLLARGSILAGSVASDGDVRTPADRAQFAAGVRTGARENLLHASFLVRVRSLLGRATPAAGRHFLSGLLIGAELGPLVARAPAHVDLIGAPPLDRCYERALRILRFRGTVARHPAGRAVIDGQALIARRHGLFR
ncbi:MAG TPA: 2-dehydro-3-deoxygalactonokinase [Opitutaceae bacterium]|nr:2-dehydro-3-deoxygalactonokinase [Opitutaceae bacterium]